MSAASTGSLSGGVNVAMPTVRIRPVDSSKTMDESASTSMPSRLTLARPSEGAVRTRMRLPVLKSAAWPSYRVSENPGMDESAATTESAAPDIPGRTPSAACACRIESSSKSTLSEPTGLASRRSRSRICSCTESGCGSCCATPGLATKAMPAMSAQASPAPRMHAAARAITAPPANPSAGPRPPGVPSRTRT